MRTNISGLMKFLTATTAANIQEAFAGRQTHF